MNRIQNLRGNIDVARQQLLQADPMQAHADAKTLAKKLRRLKPSSWSDDQWSEFVEVVAVERGWLLPRGEAKLIPVVDAEFSLTSAQAEKTARRQLRRAGVRLSNEEIIDLDNDDQEDGAFRDALASVIVGIDGFQSMPISDLCKAVIRANPNIMPVGMPLAEFENAIGEERAKLGGAGFSLSSFNNPSNTISAARAEEIANGQTNRNRRSSVDAKFSNVLTPDPEASRYDDIADKQLGRLGKSSQAKRIPPGLTALIESMTPEQRKRYDELCKRRAPIAQQKKTSEVDFILDCMQQSVERGE
jgi:hypothetical protein